MGGRRDHILPPHRLMTRTLRCKHSRPPSSHLQPGGRCRLNFFNGMNRDNSQLLRTSTNFYSRQRPGPHLSPPGPSPSRHWQVSTIWTSSLTSRCHGRPYTSLCPTSLQYNSCCRYFPSCPNKPLIRTKPNSTNYLPMPGGSHHVIHCNMRPHPE